MNWFEQYFDGWPDNLKAFTEFDQRHGFGLMQRLKKDGPLAEADDLPFIICLYLHFHNWFTLDQLYCALYGSPAEYGGRIVVEGFPHGCKFHNLEKALYYTDDQLRNNVSGVLVRSNDTYHFFKNYSSANRLTKENVELLSKIQYTHSDYQVRQINDK